MKQTNLFARPECQTEYSDGGSEPCQFLTPHGCALGHEPGRPCPERERVERWRREMRRVMPG